MRHVSVPAAPAVRVAAMEHIMYVEILLEMEPVVIPTQVPVRINVQIVETIMQRQMQRHIMYPAHGQVHIRLLVRHVI